MSCLCEHSRNPKTNYYAMCKNVKWLPPILISSSSAHLLQVSDQRLIPPKEQAYSSVPPKNLVVPSIYWVRSYKIQTKFTLIWMFFLSTSLDFNSKSNFICWSSAFKVSLITFGPFSSVSWWGELSWLVSYSKLNTFSLARRYSRAGLVSIMRLIYHNYLEVLLLEFGVLKLSF